jgi:hypothetical protein
MSAEPTESDEADAIEKDITKIRHRLGNVVEELDHRRRRAFDVRLQLARHKWALGATVLASAAVMGGLALMRTRTRPFTRRSKLIAWVKGRLPERRRPEPRPSVTTMVLKVAVALATGAASVAGKQLTERALAHARA